MEPTALPSLPKDDPSRRIPKPRVVVVGHVYHQNIGEQPKNVESRFVRLLDSDDQPIIRRRFTVGESWQKIDFGWIQKPGMLVIENLEGRFIQTIPAPDEIKEASKKVLEISNENSLPIFLIPAGEDMRGMPGADLYIRCQSGTAKYSISVMPS